MAKDVITKFKLETTQYDSKMRSAVKELSDFAKTATQAGSDFNNFTKKQVEAARAIGNMETTCTDAKGKVKELVSSFNDFARSYNALNEQQKQGDFAKAMAESLTTLQGRIKQAKAEMQGLSAPGAQGGGGFLSGISGKMDGMLSVLGGNLMTKAAGAVAQLGSEMADMVKQGVEMAKAGEGIRIAFERLGNGQILDGLREATHGTVTDIELMKAAVKFNDFKLPVEELGTMLAFAQQKAKDTGQSVDYMVDSIVTGLGRKSLMILDNLGLSASEIKEEMKKTGDMTTAVGAIIRKQMSEAGDYVETAADRAAQANVSLQNKMEELGRKFAPVEEASSQLWTSMKIGILDVVSGPLARLLNGLTEAGRLRNQMDDMAGGNSNSETAKQIKFLRNTSPGNRKARYDKQIAIYNAQEEKEWRSVNSLRAQRETFRRQAMKRGARESDMDTFNDFDRQIAEHTNKAKSWQMFRINYQRAAQPLLTTNHPAPPPPPKIPSSGGKPSHTTTTPAAELTEEQKIQKQINELVQEGMGMDEKARTAQREKIAALQEQLEGYQKIKDELLGIEKKEKETKAQEMVQGLSGVTENSLKANQSYWQGKLGGMEIGSDEYMKTQANIIDTQAFNTILNEAMKRDVSISDETKESIMQGLIDGESVREELVSLVEIINETLADSGIEPIKLDFDTGNVKKETKEVNKEWNAAASAIQAVGNAMSQIEDPAAKVLGTIAQAVATMALSYSQAANSPAVTGSGWGWIAFAATGVATMISSISAIKQATSGFANGGVIPGNSMSGDNLRGMTPDGTVYGLNSQEIILNKAQQGNLASQLTDSAVQGFGGQPYVEGEKIFLGMNNSSRRMGRGEIVTTQTLRRMGLTR